MVSPEQRVAAAAARLRHAPLVVRFVLVVGVLVSIMVTVEVAFLGGWAARGSSVFGAVITAVMLGAFATRPASRTGSLWILPIVAACCVVAGVRAGPLWLLTLLCVPAAPVVLLAITHEDDPGDARRPPRKQRTRAA